MPIQFLFKADVDPTIKRIANIESKFAEMAQVNMRTLGTKTARIMTKVIEPVKYKGTMERSISSEISVRGRDVGLTVGPTAPESWYVFYGTKPHWAPIEPLKEWARWKLGDEKLGYAVQKSIAKYGTNRGFSLQGLDGTWISQYGVGMDFLNVVMERGDFQTAVLATARRLGVDLVGEQSVGSAYTGEE